MFRAANAASHHKIQGDSGGGGGGAGGIKHIQIKPIGAQA
jgi:hypothetical protein